jgi:hypothetical protein
VVPELVFLAPIWTFDFGLFQSMNAIIVDFDDVNFQVGTGLRLIENAYE